MSTRNAVCCSFTPIYRHYTQPTWKASSSTCWPPTVPNRYLWEVMSNSSHSPMVVIIFLDSFVMFAADLPRKIFTSFAGGENKRELYCPVRSINKAHIHITTKLTRNKLKTWFITVHFFSWEVAISTKKCTRRCVKIEMYIETLPHALLLTWGTSTSSLHLHFLHFSPNWHLKKGKKRHLMKCLTQVEVGVESQRAVLYVEGEGVDIEVTGAENSGWFSIIHHPIAIQVHIRDNGGCVFIHTAKREVSRGVMSVSRLCNMMHSSFNLRDFWTAAWKQRKQIVLFYFLFFPFSWEMDKHIIALFVGFVDNKKKYSTSTIKLTIHWLQYLAPKICLWEGKSCCCRTGLGPNWQTRSSTTKITKQNKTVSRPAISHITAFTENDPMIVSTSPTEEFRWMIAVLT